MYDEILSLEQIQKGLKDKRLYAVAIWTKVSYPTLRKLADGVEANYTVGTLSAVSNYITDSQIKIEE